MDARTNFYRPDVRENATYVRAARIFNEKREILQKLSELNRELRDLQDTDADAVAAARTDVPFRNRPGRTKGK